MTSDVPYAEVIGDPIGHSRSPLIHRFWLEKLAQPGDYRAVQVARGGLGAYLEARLQDPSWRGCNVTMPLKFEALAAAGSERTERAVQAGAANLLLPEQGSCRADNSDVVAVERLLGDHFREHDEVVVHLIGTGGAASAAVAALRRLGPPVSIFTHARSEDRALDFRRKVGLEESLSECHVIGDGGAWGSGADVVLNATPLGMRGRDALPFPLEGFEAGAVVFDMVYDPLETALLAEARSRSLRVIDGLQMLVEQAAVSFACFFGVEAPRAHDAELRERLTA